MELRNGLEFTAGGINYRMQDGMITKNWFVTTTNLKTTAITIIFDEVQHFSREILFKKDEEVVAIIIIDETFKILN